jgi:modulator of FtsH protease
VLVLVLVLVLFGSGGSPIVSLIILGLSGALILVDFSYLR